MIVRRLLLNASIAACVLHGGFLMAQEKKLQRLIDRSPSPPNALGYVNIQSLNQLLRDQGLDRSVAENVEEYWFIADLSLGELRPKWEAGYSILKQSIKPEELANVVSGYVDEIAGQEVVWSPKQTYFVPLEENRLGLLRPADRSLLSGWISSPGNTAYSEYLQSKVKPAEEYLSLMLAVELKDAFSPVPMTAKIKGFQSLQANPAESVAKILASIQGMSILVGRRGLNECIVTADFSRSPASLEPIAAELFAELLSRNGTATPEVLTWSTTVSGNSLSMRGPITEATLSGVMGLFSLNDRATQATGVSLLSDSGSRSAEQQTAYRTKYYFDQVDQIVEQTRKHQSQTTGALAKWNDSRARQIDELGTLNVDPDMIQYGVNVAELLRGNALTVRQGNIDAGKTKADQALNRGYYGYDDGYGYNSTTAYQAVTSAYARGNAYSNYKDTLSQIDQLTASVRRGMTDRYQMQF
ncbi:MAG: hypothetical protein AAF670_19025 [Planctomycetota bacterium]